MSIAFVNQVQSNTVGAGSTTVTTAAMNLTAGNAVFVAVCTNRANNNLGFTIADTAGNTFHLASGSPFNPGTTWGLYIYYIYNAIGNASNVITVTYNSGNFSGQIVVAASQFSGFSTTDPFNALSSAETAAGQPINSGTVTLSGTQGVVFAPVIIDSTGGGLTPGSGFSAQLMDATSTYNYFYTEYKIVTVSTAATGTVAGTTFPNDISAAMFQIGGGGPTSSTNWLEMFSGVFFFSAPPQAVAAGYTNLTFHDEFNSINTVDVNNTQAPGYQWYVNNGWPNASTLISTYPPTAASCFSQSGTLLNCGPTVPTGGSNYGNAGLLMATACVDPNNSSNYIGKTFLGGTFYVECSMAMQQNSGQAPPCPAFWALPVEMSVNNNRIPYTEIDFMEHTSGSTNPMNFNTWYFTGTAQSLVGYVNSNYSNSLGSIDLTQQHVYGCLSVSQAANGGAFGYVKYYVDNVLIIEVQYSATGTPSPPLSGYNNPGVLSDIDTNHYYLILGWQNVGTIAVDWVRVWQ